MSPELTLSILLGSFIALFSFGVPLALSLLFSSITVIVLDPGLDLIIIPLRLYAGINNFLLLAIPGFMFAALLMNRVGITKDIVNLSDLLVGRIRGGLAHINVVSSMLMGGVSGSSTADVAGIGGILIPTMNEKGYSKEFSASLTAASSAIGSIIPPSILMVIYGATANVSIGALFIAGYLPGILVGLQQLIIAYYYAAKHGDVQQVVVKKTPKEKLIILLKGMVPLSVMVIIIGGIMSGIMTATESAAVASVYVIFVGVFIYRKITLEAITSVAIETALLTAIVMFCVGTATLFGWLMSYYHILDVAGSLFTTFATGEVTFLIFVTVIFLFLGTFMDPAPAMLIFVPVIASIAPSVGVDPLQLGILVIMALAIGKITPPYGISLLLACTISGTTLSKTLGWSFVFFGAFCFLLLAIAIWPDITLWLPRMLVPELVAH